MRLVAFLTGIFLMPFVAAEDVVNLVCVKPVDDEFLEKTTSFWESQVKQWGDKFGGYKKLEDAKKDREDCSSAQFAWKNIYTINKSLLNQSQPQSIEAIIQSCRTRTYIASAMVRKHIIKASPSYLQAMEKEGETPFVIDRKSLEAGWGIERDYKCTIEEIDTSSNAI